MLNDIIINEGPIKINRALISVYDKTNVVDLSEKLDALNVEIISTGGTANKLKQSNIPVTDLNNFTGFPEIMDGRVKTLNPLIAGGVLALRDVHDSEVTENNIQYIDLVVCNLYPFAKTVSQDNCSLSMALENIDIGGPTMIRSAAKNLGWVCVIVDPDDYNNLIQCLDGDGNVSYEFRAKMAKKAFMLTAQYESAINQYFSDDEFPDQLSMAYKKFADLRYGENPQQKSSVYINEQSIAGILRSTIHQGKELSYNNIMDADAAVSCITEFKDAACAIIKHANPCGAAISDNINDAFINALNADRLSAFGGVVALNRECNKNIATQLKDFFIEIIVAPGFTDNALDIFSNKKNLRVIELKNLNQFKEATAMRNIHGGLLLQQDDSIILNIEKLKSVTNNSINQSDHQTILFGWSVLKHVKSNGILIVKNGTTLGVGAGQVSRVDSVDIAIAKSKDQLDGSILLSDAFFPFRDSIDKIAASGIKTIIQPGGSVRDQEIIDACNEHSIAMALTGVRCFKH